VLILVIISVIFSDRTTASHLQTTSMTDGATQVAAPKITAPIPSWSLAAAEAAECPAIGSLQTTGIAPAIAAVPENIDILAEKAQLTPHDPASFSGVYTLAQLNAAGLNPGVLEGNDSLSAEYLLVVSHGSWPLSALDRSSGLGGGVNATVPSPSNQTIEWQYKILDMNSGATIGGDYIIADTTCS
jgi:hypothetical protein